MAVVSNGTTIIDAGALGSGVATGAMTLLSTVTASSSSVLSFTSGLTSSFDHYIFKFINIHPGSDGEHLQFQTNVDGATGFNESITAIHFRAVLAEADNDKYVHYHNDPSSFVQGNGTSFQPIATYLGNDNDQASNGTLTLFSPASTVSVKHYTSEFAICNSNNYIQHNFTAGYFNVTAAIDEIQFKMTSGNIDSGIIKLYGVNAG